ncbi:rhamnulose-1-phosphate aldolase [Enterococcus dongliensis]|uniref:rhamnulose-1-phosphate aldolase n=1 Tax=Enterococcus dongliensis TaxID=2559925 RepID=UPI00288CADE7|nr:rhamnulose-1-phosphate aldolase [Enterococcus dongliensis]MDT2702970.1 rhamnulose-1-phosphate aldolase [Enterococcus dongliensis]
MSKFMDSSLLKEAMETCHYFWQSGWGECHAGNLSYLLDEKQLAEYAEDFQVKRTIPIAFSTQGLVGRTFLVTRSGAVFRKILRNPLEDFGIVRIKDTALEILWGFEKDKLPTSELSAHLQCHSQRLASNENNRLVLHCHPTYTIMMTFMHPLIEKDFTETLWRLNSECVLVFPDGVGLLPWMVCGDGAIGEETAKKMRNHRIVIWPYHGMFASGNDFDEVVGLIETIEKNAHVFMETRNAVNEGITHEQVRELAEAFKVEIE